MTCPECNSKNIVEGKIDSYYTVSLVETKPKNKLFPKTHKILCKACLDCGAVFDMRIATKNK